MATEGTDRRSRAGACLCVGLADEYDFKSAALSGLLCHSADTYCTAAVSSQEVGLLDSMAFCERCKSDSLSEGRACLHADSQLPLPGKWCVVFVHMV